MKTSRRSVMVYSSRRVAVRPCSTGVPLAENGHFLVGGRGRLAHIECIAHEPAAVGLDLLARHPGMDRGDHHLLAHGIWCEDREIGDELGRALGLDPEPGAVIAAFAVAERGDEVELV